MPIEENRLLYHLTSLENIESILGNGLLSRRDNFHEFDDVAESEIIKFRKKVGLDLYVPFHFFPKNPFDGRVQIDSPKKVFIYICVSKEFAESKNFKVVTKHPIALKHLILYRYLPGGACHLLERKTRLGEKPTLQRSYDSRRSSTTTTEH